MGVGAPPSAKEEIDTALRRTKVASIKRTIFFIGSILRGIAPTREPHIFFAGGNPKCSKNARWKTDPRRSTDKKHYALARVRTWGVMAILAGSTVFRRPWRRRQVGSTAASAG